MNDFSKVSRKNIVCPTSHLKCFEELVDATGLIGEEYLPIIKVIWYSLVSMKIAKKSLSLGSIRVDGRIHPLVVMKSGGGKSEIKRVMEDILSSLNFSFIEPTSLHPEQFIGKVIKMKKSGLCTKIPGHLSLDYVLIDEGKDLLISNDPKYGESRKYLRLALDNYPNNTITKKSVDIDYENALKYTPHCVVCLFLQPYKLSEEIVLDGDIRRFIVSNLIVSSSDDLDPLRERLKVKSKNENSLEEFKKFLGSLEMNDEFVLEDDAIESFKDLSILLIEMGYTRSPKARTFMEIVRYTIQNILLKFSAIQALQDNSHVIQQKHVELAFIDYLEIMEHTYQFVETKIIGNMDYGEGWAGAMKNDQILLKWLLEKGAVSHEKTPISIKGYKEKIKEIFKIGDRQAQRKKQEHENKGWIKSQKGQHDSKVWLNFKPEKIHPMNYSKARVDKTFTETYKEILNKHFRDE